MKHLIKKFGFRSIIEEIKHHNWKLPTMEEVKKADIEYDVVWVSDIPELKSDRESHAMIYDVPLDSLELCNKNFMMNIVIIEINKRRLDEKINYDDDFDNYLHT